MTTLIICGFNSTLLVTQGYAATVGPAAPSDTGGLPLFWRRRFMRLRFWR